MNTHDLGLALLLPLPPWLGFLIYRYRGRTGMAFGYFLGGVLAVLSLPWPQIGSKGLPSAHLGGALFGFTLFLQAHREGRTGLRTLVLGVGGATFFVWIVGVQMGLDMRSVLAFWATAILEAGLWLVLSDLGYRFTQGRWLGLRMPVTGGIAFLVATALYRFLPLGVPPLSWPASLLAGILLGLVALQQLLWLRSQGIWVEGRGNGLRVALSALEGDQPPDSLTLAYVLEARQAMILVNEEGLLLETNTAFSRLAGLPRHHMRGYQLQDLFQGRDGSPWDDLRDQLLRTSRGTVQATLVHRDSSFQNVRLEAVPFDRNMALVWIAETKPGTLALRGDAEAVLQASAGQDPQRVTAEALEAILPAVEQILGETWNPRTRDAAERIIVAAQRLMARGQLAGPGTAMPHFRAQPVLEALLPRLRQMLGQGCDVAHRTPDLTLFMEADPLQRMVTHLVLHGRAALVSGTLTVVLAPVTLGTRSWARLSLELAGRPAPAPEAAFLGLTWLQQTVREALGMLELTLDERGFLWPRIYLPCKSPDMDPASLCLNGQRIWICDRDPEARATLCALVQDAGGQAQGFKDLRSLLRGTRSGIPPGLLVLERTAALDRFRNRLAHLGSPSLPTLILGDGPALPAGDGPPRRLMLLEKPFPGQNFLQCLLALSQEP